MTKQQKVFLGIGLIAVGAIAILAFTKKSSVVTTSQGGQDEQNTCPSGEKPCENNPKICFNPNANYIVDPCGKYYSYKPKPSFAPSGISQPL